MAKKESKSKQAEAKELLDKYGIRKVSPDQLVANSNKLGKGLFETLRLIAFLRSAGQGYSPFSYTAKTLSGEYV